MKRDLTTLVSQWPSSGLTQKEFCKKHKLVYQTFHYWRNKSLQQTNTSKGFIELFPSVEPSNSPSMELHFINGCRLTFFGKPEVELIKSLTR